MSEREREVGLGFDFMNNLRQCVMRVKELANIKVIKSKIRSRKAS